MSTYSGRLYFLVVGMSTEAYGHVKANVINPESMESLHFRVGNWCVCACLGVGPFRFVKAGE